VFAGPLIPMLASSAAQTETRLVSVPPETRIT
jgi:hypothetical protein